MAKILVVDDDEDMLEMVSIILSREGYDVLKASDMPSTLAIVKNEMPDLLVLDLILAHGSGIEISSELKRESKYENIPIVVMTAKTEREYQFACRILGVKEYITKPFDHEEFVGKIKNILEKKQ